MADAHCPKTVQSFVVSVGFGIVACHKGCLNSQTFFYSVIADYGTEKQCVVIGVGGKDQNVCRFARGKPILNSVRCEAVSVNAQFFDVLSVVFVKCKGNGIYSFRQADIFVKETVCSAI